MALSKGMKYQIDLLANNKSGAALKKFKGDINSVHNQVTRLGATIVAAFGTREIVQAANVMVGVENRMNALTGSATATAHAMDSMKRIAMESRSDFDSVAMLYTRLALATEHLGTTQDQLAAATQMVANTFIIAGSHTQEANNSARQLAQGLASGALRGDELRSVMENNVILTKMLAKGLNMTVGELREFGHQGGLTAEKVLPILIAGVEETNETIADMPMTLGQAGVSLRNSFQFMIGDIQKTTNAFGIIAGAATFFARNIKEILIPAITLLTINAIPKLITAFNLLRVAMLANPITAVATAFATMAAVVDSAIKKNREYGTTTEELNASLTKQKNLLKDIEDRQKKAGSSDEADLMEKSAEAVKERIRLIQELIDIKKISATIDNDLNESASFTIEDIIAQTKDAITITKSFGETVEGKLTNAWVDFFDITNKKFLEFKSLAMAVTQAVIRELLEVYVVKKLVSGITGRMDSFLESLGDDGSTGKALTLGNKFGLQDVNETIVKGKKIPSGDGGGFTGMGARAGGVDGKGGFAAILHPNETVIDHTKGQRMGATVNFNISTVDAAGFDQLLTSRKGLITQIINNAMNTQGKMGIV
jgi:tape measure domain-containing protein